MSNDYKSEEELELLDLAERGDVYTQSMLIMYYWFGDDEKGIVQDKSTALYWKQKIIDSAAQGNMLAMGSIGRAINARSESPYYYGAELATKYRDQVLAAAEAGIPAAMLAAYDIIKPETEGFKYLLRSGELGYDEAYFHLMWKYQLADFDKRQGEKLSYTGVPIDDAVDLRAEALNWAMKGAASNSLRAGDCQFELAIHYKEMGDINSYQKYLEMAASKGHRSAKKRLYWDEQEKKKPAGKGGGCYIATAVYGSYDAPEVLVLRRFRDESLAQSPLGRIFIKVYYRFSPPFAEWLKNRYMINTTMRQILNRFVTHIENR